MVETTTIRNLALAYLENNSKWSSSYDTLCHVTNSLQEPLKKMSNLQSRKNYQMELLTTRQITQSQNWNIISKNWIYRIQYLFWFSIFASNCCRYNVTSEGIIPIDNRSRHLLLKLMEHKNLELLTKYL